MSKRVFQLLISLVVAAGDWLVNQGNRLLRRRHSRCVVLAYHAVSAKERSRFARQMDVLLRAARVVPADSRTLPVHGGRCVAVTFDDGLECILENALPELRKRSIPVTLFVVADALGGNRAWEHRGGDDTRNERVISREQLKGLPSELVTIGSHSLTHAFLPAIDNNQLEQELAGSRRELEKIVDREVKLFSFPYGAFNEQVIESCRNAGYERVFTALPFRAFSKPGEFVTGRVGTAPTDWPIEFRLKLVGAYRWLPYAFVWKHRVLSVVRGRGRKSLELKVSQKKVT